MSMAAMNWARAQKLSHTRAHVLKELANRANDGGQCWPSLSRLAEDTHLSRRTVIRCLIDLETSGLIIKDKSAGHSTLYRLQLAQSTASAPSGESMPEADEVPKTVLPTPENGPPPDTEVVTACHHLVTACHHPSDSLSPPVVTECHPESPIEYKGNHQGSVSAPAPVPAVRETAPQPKSKRRQKRALPADFKISARVQEWATSKGYDRLDEHLEAFIDTSKAHGYKYASWDDALMKAIREDWANINKPAASPEAKTDHATKADHSEPKRKSHGGNVIDFADFAPACHAPAVLNPEELDPVLAERLRRSREQGIRELERLDAEANAMRIARLGGLPASRAMA